LLVVASLLWPWQLSATELSALGDYLDATRSLRAEFLQSSPDPRGGDERRLSGRVVLQKPAHFRWDYVEPYVQVIVGDGERIWQYDADLDQATVQAMDETLAGTPLALLSGSRPVQEAFVIEAQGFAGDLEWFRFLPSAPEEGEFESIRLALRDGVLAQLELVDALGQTTRIEFRALQRNVPIDPAVFEFEPPPGADVIGGDG
jgi:outer membrane lipoprotein carrier protein